MTDRITDEDLEQLDAWLDDWRKCEISAESVAIVMEQYLPGLIAELRELREALRPFAAASESGIVNLVPHRHYERAARILDGLPAEERPGEWDLHLETSHPDG